MSKPTTPVAGARAGRYLFVRQITTSYTGALWETRCEADGGKQFLALTRVVRLPTEMDAGVEECLASAAWDGLELDGEGIARVAEVVFEKGWFAIVHDHYDGDTVMTMQRRVTERKSAFPVPVALRILIDAIEAAASALAVTKELSLDWRAALYPGSLFVCDDGRTRLLDGFMSGVIPKIPNMVREADYLAYSAPEQFEVGALATEQSDVFALGILAWELLSSKRFQVGNRQVMERRLQSAPSRVDQMSRVGKRASRAVADAVNRALATDPAERFQTLQDFAKALRSGDDGVATQQQVIEFTDALAGRESTLARLLMDKPPRLSDELRQGRAETRKSAKKDEAKSKAAKKAVRAPDAMFKPTPAQASSSSAQAAKAGPAIFGGAAAASAGLKTSTQGAKAPASSEGKAATTKYGSPLAPPLAVPSRKQTVKIAAFPAAAPPSGGGFQPKAPAPSAAAVPPAAAAATPGPGSKPAHEARPMAALAGPGAQSPKPRNRFNTLIGLSAQDVATVREQAARATASALEEAPLEPDSSITAVHAKQQQFDDADEEPTTIFRIGESAEPSPSHSEAQSFKASAKSVLDLSQDEQELDTREYSQDMLAEALKEAPEPPAPTPAAGNPARADRRHDADAKSGVQQSFVKSVVAVPAPLPSPAFNPAMPVPAPVAPPSNTAAGGAPSDAATPSARLPAPSSPGFERGELPPLEHSGPPAVLPALKPAVLPDTSTMAASSLGAGAPQTSETRDGVAIPAAAEEAARPVASPSANRYRVVAFFFAGTTLLMAAAAIGLFLYARGQAPSPVAAPAAQAKVSAPVKAPEPPKAVEQPKPADTAPEAAAEEAPEAKDDAAEDEAVDAAGDEGASDDEKADSEGEADEQAEAKGAEQAEAQVAQKPKPVVRAKPRRRAKPKPKPKPTRFVPTDI